MNIKAPDIMEGEFESALFLPKEERLLIPSGRPHEEQLFLACHELRHHYQLLYSRVMEDETSLRIRHEMEHYEELPYQNLYIEQDAYFFASYALKEVFRIPYEPSFQAKEMISRFEKNFSFVFSVFQ